MAENSQIYENYTQTDLRSSMYPKHKENEKYRLRHTMDDCQMT